MTPFQRNHPKSATFNSLRNRRQAILFKSDDQHQQKLYDKIISDLDWLNRCFNQREGFASGCFDTNRMSSNLFETMSGIFNVHALERINI